MAFGLALIIIFGLGADYIFKRMKLPGLIGMLIVVIFVAPRLLDITYLETAILGYILGAAFRPRYLKAMTFFIDM